AQRLAARQLPLQLRGARGRAHEVVEHALAVDRLAGSEVARPHAVARRERFPRLDRTVCGITDGVEGGDAVGHPQPAQAVAVELALDVLVRVRFPEAGNDGLLRGVDDVARSVVHAVPVRLDAVDAIAFDYEVQVGQLIGYTAVPDAPGLD